jgi:hypothetical protein
MERTGRSQKEISYSLAIVPLVDSGSSRAGAPFHSDRHAMQNMASSVRERSQRSTPFPEEASYFTILKASEETPLSPKKERKCRCTISFASEKGGALPDTESEKDT